MNIVKDKDLTVRILVAAAWLSLLPAQMFRWQPEGFGTAGILASDIVAFLILPFALYLLFKEKSLWKDRVVQLLLGWIGVVVLSFVVASFQYPLKEIVVAAGYVARLSVYLLTFIVAYQYSKQIEGSYIRYGILVTAALFLLGLLIMWQLPDFAPLAVLGWDPHVGRLTSTWLDPNYYGSFVALVFAGALAFERQLFANKRDWLLLLAFLAICWISIYLTVSRSAMVTLAAAALVASVRTSWRAVLITGAALLLLVVVPSRLQDRLVSSVSFIGGATSGSTTGTTPASTDPTANARVESWKRAWELATVAPVLGVGYNYYEPATINLGLLPEEGQTRGTTGSDSSLLTLLATTGWLGLLAVAAFFLTLFWRLFTSPGPWPTVGLAAIAGMAVGSQFNNFLLYPLALLPFMLGLGIAYRHSQRS